MFVSNTHRRAKLSEKQQSLCIVLKPQTISSRAYCVEEMLLLSGFFQENSLQPYPGLFSVDGHKLVVEK